MKKIIRVVSHRFPKRGRFIGEGSWEYVVTSDGLPAMAFRWHGMMFPGPKATFVFSRDVVQIGAVADDVAKSQARWSGFLGASNKGGAGGLVVSLVSGAIGAAAARTSEIKGFGVVYRNEGGHLGTFMAVASPEIVDEIFRAVPQEKHDKSAQPSESSPPTQPSKPA